MRYESTGRPLPNVNVTLESAQKGTSDTFPCPLCRMVFNLRRSRAHKPYCVCNSCGVQIFFRGKKGIAKLGDFVGHRAPGPVPLEFTDSRAIFVRLEDLRCAKNFTRGQTAPDFLRPGSRKRNYCDRSRNRTHAADSRTIRKRRDVAGHSQMRAALYARVSTASGQHPEMQLHELREFCGRRGWNIAGEYVDVGVSGAKESRPQLDHLLAAARRRRFDAVVVYRYDRFARSLRQLVGAFADFEASRCPVRVSARGGGHLDSEWSARFRDFRQHR